MGQIWPETIYTGRTILSTFLVFNIIAIFKESPKAILAISFSNNIDCQIFISGGANLAISMCKGGAFLATLSNWFRGFIISGKIQEDLKNYYVYFLSQKYGFWKSHFRWGKFGLLPIKRIKINGYWKYFIGVSTGFLCICAYNFRWKNINNKENCGWSNFAPHMSELPHLNFHFKFEINLIYSVNQINLYGSYSGDTLGHFSIPLIFTSIYSYGLYMRYRKKWSEIARGDSI